MATIVKGRTGPSNTGNRWTEEEVRIYEETCEGYKASALHSVHGYAS